jgi:DNA-binding NtrC family response regulator
MTKPEILVIDENTKILFAFESLLEREGCITISAETAHQALLKIAQHKPKALFIDISLQDKGHLNIIEKIRQTHPYIPVILITSQNVRNKSELIEKFDANGYLEKPFSIETVRKVLKGLKIK